MRLLILVTKVPWGEERSMMSRFLPEYLLVATPIAPMWKVGNEGEEKGPIMNLFFTSFWRRVVTVSRLVVADRRFLQMWLDEGVVWHVRWEWALPQYVHT